MASKRPAFQFYPREYLTDEHVILMSLEEQGAYVRLLCHQWLEGSIPSEVPALARLCGVAPAKMRRMWESIALCFEYTSDMRLVNGRLERSRVETDEWIEKSRQAGIRSGEARRNKTPTATLSLVGGLVEPTLDIGSRLVDRVVEPKSNTASASVKKKQITTSGKAGWTERFGLAWIERFGGTANYGRIGKAIKPLLDSNPEQDVLDAWVGYLAGKSPEFASPQDFASKFGLYSNGNGGKSDPEQEWLDKIAADIV